jgi:small conductance mechanosensitive channel
MDAIHIPDFVKPYLPRLEGLLIAVAIFAGGWIASKWANRLTRRGFKARQLDPALGGFLASMLQYTVVAAAVITALGQVGIHTTSLVAVFASAGIAVGLALQGSLSSFASGVLILFFRPFDIDHKITAAGHTGVVKEIGLLATTLLTADNEEILVPNSAVTGGSIVNFSAQGTLRSHVAVSVAFGNDVAKVSGVLLGAAKKVALVLRDPAPSVAVAGAGKSLDLVLLVWSKATDQSDALHLVRTAVYDDLRAAEIPMPEPSIVIKQVAA